MSANQEGEESPEVLKKIGSAGFYALSSIMITVVNKTVLTSFGFPSYQVLGLGQIIATIIVLGIGKQCHIIDYPSLDRSVVRRIWPLPLIYLGNMTTGLGGTKELSLPMFTALRRFSIMMTMIAEQIVLGVKATRSVQVSVLCMVSGALLAAFDDVTFNATGYTLVLLNDIFTATNGVYMKKKLDSKDLGKYGLMYYNALFVIVPAVVTAWMTGDISKSAEFEGWMNIFFLTQFVLSCVMGFILTWSTIMCTHYNSALTTAIVGCLKNIFITYLGMVIGGDYVFSYVNFIGLNISVLGSFFYTYVTFKRKPIHTYETLRDANARVETV